MPSNSTVNSAPPTLARILYKQIKPGDLKKFRAKSNVSATGGGARDLRFGRFPSIEGVVRQMFPQTKQETRVRQKKQVLLNIFTGRFHWVVDGENISSCEVSFESPTTARASEGRLATVHQIPCFAQDLIPSLDGGNVVILLFIQLSDNTVWPHFTDVRSLSENEDWDPRVSGEILRCIASKRPAQHAVIGYKDYTDDSSYCNGK